MIPLGRRVDVLSVIFLTLVITERLLSRIRCPPGNGLRGSERAISCFSLELLHSFLQPLNLLWSILVHFDLGIA